MQHIEEPPAYDTQQLCRIIHNQQMLSRLMQGKVPEAGMMPLLEMNFHG